MNQTKFTTFKENVDWVKITLWTVILVLSLFLFKSCEGEKELQLTNIINKNEIKRIEKESQEYVDIANTYKDSVFLLKQKKEKVRERIVYVKTKTKKELEKVSSLNTTGIADYFYDRYKLPIPVTKYGISLSDTVAHKAITDLVLGEGYKAQLDICNDLLRIEEKENTAKDTIISNQDKVIDLKNKSSDIKDDIIKNAEKSVKKERNKKTFWQVTAGIAITVATWLAVKP